MHDRQAGQHARERVKKTARMALAAIGVAGLVAVATGLAYGWFSKELLFAEALVIAVCVGIGRFIEPSFDRWDRGATGEEAVGAVIAGLGAQWRALHDVSFGRGNIDHILIGPGGLFTIETKSHAGRLRIDRLDAAMFKQAYAESKLLERVAGQPVVPLLVFSRAYIDKPGRRKGVQVLPARLLAGHLARRRVVFNDEEVERVYSRLAFALD